MAVFAPQRYSTCDVDPAISQKDTEVVRIQILKEMNYFDAKCSKDFNIVVKGKVKSKNSVAGRLCELATEGIIKRVKVEDHHSFYVLAYEWEREDLVREMKEKRIVRALTVALEDDMLPMHVRQCLDSRVKELRGEK